MVLKPAMTLQSIQSIHGCTKYMTTCSKKIVSQLVFCCLTPRWENKIEVVKESFQEKQLKLFKKIQIIKNRYSFPIVENYQKFPPLTIYVKLGTNSVGFFFGKRNLLTKQNKP